jgi:MOSC domain-containing protein YiiM
MPSQTTPAIVSINISRGGVPKTPVPQAEITTDGLVGDHQNDRRHHGGPERAVCLYALEVIERLRAEGHPIAPGTTGENLTIRGLDWAQVGEGSRFIFDRGVELEVVQHTTPCKTIRESFKEGRFERILHKTHPGESRVYARVLTPGVVREGEGVRLEAPVEA